MGGRQSSQNVSRHRDSSPTQGSSRYSSASLDNASILSRPSGSIDLSGDRPVARRRRRRDRNDQFIEAHSLPSHLFPFVTAEIKCPVCNKRIGTTEIESHLLACLAKPRVSYNEDVLQADAGECIICFDDMQAGEHIARLPCLCIYHKKCLDEWFSRNRCCPAHPEQIPHEYAESSTSSVQAAATTSAATTDTNNQQQQSTGNDNDDYEIDHSVSAHIDIEQPPHPALNANSLAAQGANIEPTPPQIISLNDSTGGGIVPMLELDNRDAGDPSSGGRGPLDMPRVLDGNAATADDCSCSPPAPTLTSSTSNSSREPRQKTIVHVDDGSIHGSPNLFDEDEIAQLASKIKTILVQESPRGGGGSARDYDGT